LDKQKSTIQDILFDKTTYKAEFEEKIDEAIISGLVIDLGSLVLDGSLSNKLRKIIPYLKK
jgi:F0F1-type ATP synthase delta subunit